MKGYVWCPNCKEIREIQFFNLNKDLKISYIQLSCNHGNYMFERHDEEHTQYGGE